MVTAGSLVLIMSASHVKDAGGEQPMLTYRGAVSAQVEVAVLVGERADSREHPSELGPCTRSAAGAGFVGIDVRSTGLIALSDVTRSPWLRTVVGMCCSTVVMAAPFCGLARLGFPSASGSCVFSLAAIGVPRHRSQRPFRRRDSRNEHLPASCKSKSSRENVAAPPSLASQLAGTA